MSKSLLVDIRTPLSPGNGHLVPAILLADIRIHARKPDPRVTAEASVIVTGMWWAKHVAKNRSAHNLHGHTDRVTIEALSPIHPDTRI